MLSWLVWSRPLPHLLMGSPMNCSRGLSSPLTTRVGHSKVATRSLSHRELCRGILVSTTNYISSAFIKQGPIDTRYYWDLTKHIFRYGHRNQGSEATLAGVHTINEGRFDVSWKPIRIAEMIDSDGCWGVCRVYSFLRHTDPQRWWVNRSVRYLQLSSISTLYFIVKERKECFWNAMLWGCYICE